jgi:hypothetical protein
MRAIVDPRAPLRYAARRGAGRAAPAAQAADPVGHDARKKQPEFAGNRRVFVCEKANRNGWHPYD